MRRIRHSKVNVWVQVLGKKVKRVEMTVPSLCTSQGKKGCRTQLRRVTGLCSMLQAIPHVDLWDRRVVVIIGVCVAEKWGFLGKGNLRR